MSQLIASYKNGNYRVTVFEDGTKIRRSDFGYFKPDFPESIDLKVTNYCNLSDLCVYCHEMSNKAGKHADVANILNMVEGLPYGVEIAIGGGNPLSHPQINDIVDELSVLGLICNLTVNQEHYGKFKIPDKVKGVGISFRRQTKLNIIHNHVIHHLILGVHTYEDFLWICAAYNCPKILWLGFKSIGNGNAFRKSYFEEVKTKIANVKDNLHKATKHTNLIAFDNLAIAQLYPHPIFDQGDYMGDDGQYSFYYDAVEDVYSIGSSHITRTKSNGKTAQQIFKALNEGDSVK